MKLRQSVSPARWAIYPQVTIRCTKSSLLVCTNLFIYFYKYLLQKKLINDVSNTIYSSAVRHQSPPSPFFKPQRNKAQMFIDSVAHEPPNYLTAIYDLSYCFLHKSPMSRPIDHVALRPIPKCYKEEDDSVVFSYK